MYELKKIIKVFTSKFIGTGPSSYEKRIYRPPVSQSLKNTALSHQYEGTAFVRNAGKSYPSHTGPHPRRYESRAV